MNSANVGMVEAAEMGASGTGWGCVVGLVLFCLLKSSLGIAIQEEKYRRKDRASVFFLSSCLRTWFFQSFPGTVFGEMSLLG